MRDDGVWADDGGMLMMGCGRMVGVCGMMGCGQMVGVC